MANTLIGKIASASIKVGALKPDKTNTHQNYDYISADLVLDRAGAALAEVGIVILPSIIHEETERVDYTDNYGKAKSRFDCVVHFAMIISDGETQLEMPWRGRGNDSAVPDKAMYKAITSGHKYFLMKLLNVGVGNEDGEHENLSQAAQDAQPAPQRKPAQPDKPRADKVQLDMIDDLGKVVYNGEWEGNKNKLAEWASQGARTELADLYQSEAAKLIKALEKKIEPQPA